MTCIREEEVINSTCNKRMQHCLCCIFCERPVQCPHLPQMIETFARQTSDVRSKGQHTVKQDTLGRHESTVDCYQRTNLLRDHDGQQWR